MADGLAHDQDNLARFTKGDIHGAIEIVDQSHSANLRRRLDRDTTGFVVERDIARNDWEVECKACLAHPLDGADELTHHIIALGASEVHAIRHR